MYSDERHRKSVPIISYLVFDWDAYSPALGKPRHRRGLGKSTSGFLGRLEELPVFCFLADSGGRSGF